MWKGLVVRTDALESQFEKKVSRVIFQMRKKTLEQLFKGKKDIRDVDEELYSPEMALLEKWTGPLYAAAIEVGLESFFDEVGIDLGFTLNDPMAIEYMSAKRLLIRGVGNTIKNQIKTQIIEGLGKGEDTVQIGERIKSIYNFADNRVAAIARTEVVGSANFGRNVCVERSGFREKQWFTAMDERVRPDHRAMHGRKINVGDNWVLPDGSTLRFPGDYRGPARQTINCRCTTTIVRGTYNQ
jgi:hypothetical protein